MATVDRTSSRLFGHQATPGRHCDILGAMETLTSDRFREASIAGHCRTV